MHKKLHVSSRLVIGLKESENLRLGNCHLNWTRSQVLKIWV